MCANYVVKWFIFYSFISLVVIEMDMKARMGDRFEDYQSRARSKLDEILQELVDKSEERLV